MGLKEELADFLQSNFFFFSEKLSFCDPSLSFENLEFLSWFLQVVLTGLANTSF